MISVSRILKTLFLCLLLAIWAIPTIAFSPAIGLEVTNHLSLPVYVEHLPSEADRIVLNREDILNLAKEKLRQSGITPTDVSEDKPSLFIQIALSYCAFNVSVQFRRTVEYEANGKAYRSDVISWKVEETGNIAGNPKPIFKSLEGLLDIFNAEYLKVNGSM